AVETMVYFLDAVMTEFITRLEGFRDSKDPRDNQIFEFMKKAYKFAVENRAIGVGVLGWHSYLQEKMLPIESKETAKLNIEIFNNVKNQAYDASEKLAKEYGVPKILKGYGRSHTTLLAIAPTTSSAFIQRQVSQSIEPIWSNCY